MRPAKKWGAEPIKYDQLSGETVHEAGTYSFICTCSYGHWRSGPKKLTVCPDSISFFYSLGSRNAPCIESPPFPTSAVFKFVVLRFETMAEPHGELSSSTRFAVT